MAIARNLILDGVSGKIGDTLVISQRGGKTIISQARGKRRREASEAQKAHMMLFQQATIYGRSQMVDEAAKADYADRAGGMKSAYNVAVADFFHAPDIDEIDLSGYSGSIGDPIRVRAIDDFKVVEVFVRILNADGSLVEEGNAVQSDNLLDWIYSATAVNETLEGDKIIVRASDKPGNIKEAEESL